MDKPYMNSCPVCDQPFFCEHKLDFRCPYCRVKKLEALISSGFQQLSGRDVADALIENAELKAQLDAAKRFARAVWMGEGSLDEDFIKYIERTALGGDDES